MSYYYVLCFLRLPHHLFKPLYLGNHLTPRGFKINLMLEGVMCPTEGEEKSSVSPSCDFPRGTTITDQTRYAHWYNVGTDVMKVTNHFLIVSQGRFMRRNPYLALLMGALTCDYIGHGLQGRTYYHYSVKWAQNLMTPNDLVLYPQFSASLNFYQRSF